MSGQLSTSREAAEKETRAHLKYLIDHCDNIKSPLTIIHLSEQFKNATNSSASASTMYSRVKTYGEQLQHKEMDITAKVKQLFGFGVSLQPEVFQRLCLNAHVEVDIRNRITKYVAHDGSLTLEGDHSVGAKKSAAKREMKRKTDVDEDDDVKPVQKKSQRAARAPAPSCRNTDEDDDKEEHIMTQNHQAARGDEDSATTQNNDTPIALQKIQNNLVPTPLRTDPATQRNVRYDAQIMEQGDHRAGPVPKLHPAARTSLPPQPNSTTQSDINARVVQHDNRRATPISNVNTHRTRFAALPASPTVSRAAVAPLPAQNNTAPTPPTTNLSDVSNNRASVDAPIGNQDEMEVKPNVTDMNINQGGVMMEPKVEHQEYLNFRSHVKLVESIQSIIMALDVRKDPNINKSLERICDNPEVHLPQISISDTFSAIDSCLRIIQISGESVENEESTSLQQLLFSIRTALINMRVTALNDLTARVKTMEKEVSSEKKISLVRIQMALTALIGMVTA